MIGWAGLPAEKQQLKSPLLFFASEPDIKKLPPVVSLSNEEGCPKGGVVKLP